MSGVQTPARANTVSASHAGLTAGVALAACVAIWALLFFREITAAIDTWRTSTAYGHCFLVLPMALFLIWERRTVIRTTPVRPSFPLAALGLPVGLAWLAAERLGIMEARQLMAVAALEVLLLAVLGPRMIRALLGPLLYLFFLVPFGMFLTPYLQHFTARFTSIGLDLLGIANYSNDLVIEIPAGTFLVAEACAGLRFLIASIAFGVFYALMNYRSPVRRSVFILASIVVPIIANGFRALGIVILGTVLGSAEAATADHIIYGWVFFSLVMLLLVFAGLPLREDPVEPAEAAPVGSKLAIPALMWTAVATCVLLAIGPAAARLLDASVTSAPLASMPALTLPPGCAWGYGTPEVPASRIERQMRCNDVRLDVVVRSFPARSTAAAMRMERLRLTGELAAEDTSFSTIASGSGGGAWTVAQSYRPFAVVALAGWVDGRPAEGGLGSRLVQARDSVFGSAYAPVLISVAARDADAMSTKLRSEAIGWVTALVRAQAGLTEQVAMISRR